MQLYKDPQLLTKTTNILGLLADKNRLRIIKLLECKSCCVCELAYMLNIKQPSVSQHLKKLREAGIINSNPDGLWTNYSLCSKDEPYVKLLLTVVSEWLNGDEEIKKDKSRIMELDRNNLCVENKKNGK